MPTTDPGAASAAVAELSFTSGAGDYVLSGALAGNAGSSYFRFADFYNDGDTFTYRATDTSYTEIAVGTYNSGPDTISRTTFKHSNTGNFIAWPDTGQRMITPVPPSIPLCPTPPTNGQVLMWDAATGEWCPADIPASITLCPTPPTNGQVLIWSAAENAWCPADFCALVAACLA